MLTRLWYLYRWFVLGGLILFLFLVWQIGTCKYKKLEAEGNVLKGKWEQQVKDYEENDMKRSKLIREHEAKIDELNGMVDSSNTVISNLATEDKRKLSRTRTLEEAADSLDDTEYVARIANLEKQVSVWKDRFNLCQQGIAEKDKIIFALNEKYATQLNISKEFEVKCQQLQGLLSTAQGRFQVAEKKLSSARFRSTVKTMAVAGLAGGLVYSLLKK